MSGEGRGGGDGWDDRGLTSQAIAFVLATVGAAGAAALTDPPDGWLPWVLFILCVAMVALAGTRLGWMILRNIGKPLSKLRHLAKPLLLILFVVLLTGGLWYVSRPLIGRTQVLLFGCGHPTVVQVLTTPEMLDTYGALAEGYERHSAGRNHGCRTVELHVYAPPEKKGIEGLKAGWSAEYLREQGPRPDIWLPATGVDIEEVRVQQRRTGFGPELRANDDPIAFTPIVLGMPMAAGIGRNDDTWQGQSWAALLGKLERAGLDVVRPAPEVSSTAKLGTVAIYTSPKPGGSMSEHPSEVRNFESRVRRSLAAGGYPADGDSVGMLRRQAELDPGRPVLVSEQALIRFNQSLRIGSGRGCDVQNGPARCLLAFYPSDTHKLDFPFVRLIWTHPPASAEQQAAAEDFGRWLASDSGHAALIAVGLRPSGRPVSSPIEEANGVLPGGPQLHPPLDNPGDAIYVPALTAYAEAIRPGAVLITLDASGSMSRPVAGAGTRFTAAAGAVAQVADLLAQRNVPVSFSVFSSNGITALGGQALAGVRPSGNTPQYRTIVEGVRAVGPGGVLVVVTDGVNNTDVPSDQEMRAAAAGGVRVVVLAFGEAVCDTVLVGVANQTGGTCRVSTVDSLASDLATLVVPL